MQAAIKHYPLTTNQSEMFQEWEEDTHLDGRHKGECTHQDHWHDSSNYMPT